MSTNLPDVTWTHRTGGGIPYKLVSQSGGIRDYEVEAQEEIIIQTNRLASLGRECFPPPFVVGNGLHYPPRRRFPGLPHLHVVDLTWDAMDDSLPVMPFAGGKAPTYLEHARVQLRYTPVPFEDEEDPADPLTFLQISANVSASFIHGELRGAFDEDDNEIKDPDVPHMTLEVQTEWTLRWPRIPAQWFDGVLIPRMRDRKGKVNRWASRVWKNSPAETILFAGYDFSTERQWSPVEGEKQAPINCTMKFMEKNFKTDDKQITHNHFWVPGKKGKEGDPGRDPLGWQKIRLAVDPDVYTFETTDLDAIFTG